MKTLRLVLGILSIVLSAFMLVVSSVGMISSVIIENETRIMSSLIGGCVSFIILAAGITAICTRKSKIGTIITGIIFLFGKIISTIDIYIIGRDFGNISLVLAIIFILSSIIQFFIKPKNK